MYCCRFGALSRGQSEEEEAFNELNTPTGVSVSHQLPIHVTYLITYPVTYLVTSDWCIMGETRWLRPYWLGYRTSVDIVGNGFITPLPASISAHIYFIIHWTLIAGCLYSYTDSNLLDQRKLTSSVTDSGPAAPLSEPPAAHRCRDARG